MGMQGTKTSCQGHEVIDNDMKLYEYIPKQCEKAERICKFLNLEHKSLLKVFIEPKFLYCPLVWMFCRRISNNCINHLHELHQSSLVSNKAKNNLSSKIMFELFPRRFTDFSLRSTNTSDCRLKPLRYLAPNSWNLAPQDIQSVNSLSQFIGEIKSWILVAVIVFYVAHILSK